MTHPRPEEEMERINVRRGAPMMAAFFLVAFTACGGSDSTGPSGGGGGGGGGGTTFTMTTSVTVENNSFTPANIQVSPGATVTWTWAASVGSVQHNVNFASASITDIADFSSGAHTATMPATAGDYTYQCTHHPGMTGTVRVQ